MHIHAHTGKDTVHKKSNARKKNQKRRVQKTETKGTRPRYLLLYIQAKKWSHRSFYTNIQEKMLLLLFLFFVYLFIIKCT
jgi:hypothetical protein